VARVAVWILSLALCLLAWRPLCAQPSASAEFEEAVDAFMRGDYAGALPTLRELSERGDPPSQYLLAVIYLNGSSVARNEMAAAFWLHRAVLRDYAPAQYQLAVMLDEGLGIGEDRAVARILLEHAALREDASAQHRLKIENTPLGSDEEELQAAERLHALNDESGAFLHRLRLARRGNLEAQHAVGLAYLFGDGTVRNADKALEWLRKAGAAGNMRSQALLGTLLQHGEDVKHDPREALDWLRKAAQQGDQNAAQAAKALAHELEKP
jgi:TPR repeat protein